MMSTDNQTVPQEIWNTVLVSREITGCRGRTSEDRYARMAGNVGSKLVHLDIFAIFLLSLSHPLNCISPLHAYNEKQLRFIEPMGPDENVPPGGRNTGAFWLRAPGSKWQGTQKVSCLHGWTSFTSTHRLSLSPSPLYFYPQGVYTQVISCPCFDKKKIFSKKCILFEVKNFKFQK